MMRRPARFSPLLAPLAVFFALLLGALLVPLPAWARADVILQVREQQPWTLPANLERVAIADPGVADVVMLKGRQALLVGKTAGTTTLLLWHRTQTEPQRLQVEVRSAVQGALSDGDDLQLTVQEQQGLLQGSAPSLLAHERSRKAAQATLGREGQLADVSTISSGGVVQVDVKVVEFNKTVLRQIGMNFANQNNGFSYGVVRPGGVMPTIAPPVGSVATSTDANPLSSAFGLVFKSFTHNWAANIDLLQSNGMARVLAEPSLVALSGQSASFLAGGELPILEPQGLGTTTVTFKPFGIGLTVTPTVLSPDRIALKVAPEASDLNYAAGIAYNGVQIPSITTRRADTTVELGDGETFVIGGLVSSSVSSNVDKVPLLGDLPIIGSFFRSLNYKKEEKELVIIVTPRLVQPLAKGTTVPLPGEREATPNQPVWGAWLLSPASSDQLPGFSR
ncbi:type II and III secretion system protein family protein [Stenotrophomonas sp. PS02289]|uniref:type II and III secretion system protein family protein n=1 Tax=Stenotrophomonas sp. PS02289 TaxID=2991422 RepID=UPI002499E83D|nr:type II and III secretion system protein family protein [Stenotrophomonas sp. PS02289]